MKLLSALRSASFRSNDHRWTVPFCPVKTLPQLNCSYSLAFTPNWKILPILNRVKFLLPAFDEVLWNWVPREANRVADAAAKLAMVRLCSSDWASMPPTSLFHILRSDDPSD
ncbi:hypothetical protein ACLB2K_019177 [Fragaria x ananassa]